MRAFVRGRRRGLGRLLQNSTDDMRVTTLLSGCSDSAELHHNYLDHDHIYSIGLDIAGYGFCSV
jgi:hypothetical protein